MTPIGWFIMIAAVGGITTLLGWCIYRVLTTPDATRHLHTQADIEPPDTHRTD